MTNWIHRFLNPHCPHCIDEYDRRMVCDTCEVLKQQLAVANNEIHRLLDTITAKPEPEPAREPVKMTLPNKNIPWSVRRQMLEQEDREKAKIMRSAPQPVTTEDLEKELDIAAAQREIEH